MSRSKKKAGVYKITNTANGKVYIGSSVDLMVRKGGHFSSLRKGKHPNKHLQRAFDKYTEACFVFEIIERCPEDQSILLEREQFHIDATGSAETGYNIRRLAHSNFGLRHTEEAKKKCYDANKGRPKSAETRAKLSAAHKGKTVSAETRKKLSEANKGKTISPENLAKLIAAHLGKPRSPETKAKISAANKGRQTALGRPCSAETKAKIGAKNRINRLGKKASAETRLKMSIAQQLRSDQNREKTMSDPKRMEHIRNLGLASKGSHPSKETLEKMSLAHKGRKMSEEARRKSSETKRKWMATPEGEAFKKRISELKKGNQYALGRKYSEEEKKKRADARSATKC